MSLKEKTVKGLVWSFIDNVSGQLVTFIVGIVLARLLSPKEFGLVGMLSIFIAVSQIFVNSGFSQALIRKKNATQIDFSTVFFFNFAVGIFFYLVLFFSANAIAVFFSEPQLKELIRVLGLSIIINGFTIIQITSLTKNLDFKSQAKIAVTSAIISGLLGVVLAYVGWGVWSLVFRTVLGAAISSFLLWLHNKWRPSLVFSKESFRELFGFGSKLMLTSLIDTTYKNLYSLIIGKYYSAQDLGFYSRAVQFRDLPSHNITSIVQKVAFPVLSQLHDDPVRLKAAYKKMIQNILFVTSIFVIGMAASAEHMVIGMIGEKWRESILYLQLLSLTGLTYPLHVMNLSMLQTLGYSNLILKLEVIKKSIIIPVIFVGIFWGIKYMIMCSWITTFIALYLNSYWSGKFISYSIREQVRDIMPSLLIAIFMGVLVFFAGKLIVLSSIYVFLIQILLSFLIIIVTCEISKFEVYLGIKTLVLGQFKNLHRSRK